MTTTNRMKKQDEQKMERIATCVTTKVAQKKGRYTLNP